MKEIHFKKADCIKVIAETASYIDNLDDNKGYKLEIKEDRQRRSLDANAYCWVLLDKLAAKLNMKKEDIYRSYIKEIGGNNRIVCCINAAVDELREIWSDRGTGWVTDTLTSKLDGCTNVVLYYGSSVYDTKQMSRLIDLIVQDCKIYNIETKTPEELARLAEEWGR